MSISKQSAMVVDLAALKRLPAQRVAEDLGAIHRDGIVGQVGRWCWAGGDSAYLQFFRDGSYFDHKRGTGGTAIDLAIQWLDPDRGHNQQRFGDAASMLADRYGCWRDYRSERQRAKDESRAAKTIAAGESVEASAFFDLIGIGPATMNITPTSGVAWSPVVPWQGVQSCRSGWTKERAQQRVRGEDALRVLVIDLDGHKAGDGSRTYARVDELEHLCDRLAGDGIGPRALVISSWQGEARAKAHIYFVASRRARDYDEYQRWHQSICSRIASMTDRWSWLPAEDRLALSEVDEASAKISGMIRVPSSAKPGGDAAIVLRRFEGVTMSVEELSLVDTCFEVPAGKVRHTYYYGRECKQVTVGETQDGDLVSKTARIAQNVWPIALSTSLDDDTHGILYRYRSDGETRTADLPLGATIEKNAGKRASTDAATAGVEIRAGTSNSFAFHLGRWKDQLGLRHVYTTRRPGWHRGGSIYVGGKWAICGDVEIIDSPQIARRSSRKGSLAEWASCVSQIMTPAIMVALGQSIAGPLVSLLGSDPWILHIHGPSSSGKSSAAALASSVWGDPVMMPRWNTTQNGLEALAQGADGACLVLDELHQFRGRRDQLGQVVHDLCSPVGRIRLRKTGAMIAPRVWSITVLSTGEVKIAQKLGGDQQGGHAVRCLDFGAQMTLSAEHSDRIYDLSQRCHGHAGEAFVRHVIDVGAAELKAAHEVMVESITSRCEDIGAESGRVARRLATIVLALALARDAGVMRFEDAMLDEAEALLVEEIIVSREDEPTCPEERAWRSLQAMMASHPARFPREHSEPRTQIVGWIGEAGTVLYTCASMLDSAGIEICTRAGITPDRFIGWLRERSLAAPPSERKRIGGTRRRWVAIYLDD